MRSRARVFGSHVFVKRLHLDPQHDRHVVPCVFHNDGETASLSVDLSKGLFFCFGSCDDPKGGDAVAFLVKWARIKERKIISRDDARRQLSSSFTTITAQQAIVEALRDEIRSFVRFSLSAGVTFADVSREIDRQIEEVTLSCRGVPPSDTSFLWDELAGLYRERQEFDGYDETARSSLRRIRPETVRLFELAKARGWWTPVTYRRRAALAETQQQIESRVEHHFTTTTKEPSACPSSRSRSPMPTPPKREITKHPMP